MTEYYGLVAGLREGKETCFRTAADVIEQLDADNKRLQEEIDTRNMASSKALDELWKEIILVRKPNYGDWEYPMQVKRHIVCEFDQLQAHLSP